MKTIKKFPLKGGWHSSLSDTPVKINGMKVLFDEKVQLMPVRLMKKTTKAN